MRSFNRLEQVIKSQQKGGGKREVDEASHRCDHDLERCLKKSSCGFQKTHLTYHFEPDVKEDFLQFR